MIADLSILVTGAEDAVGGRLVERLVLGGARVRAIVRHPAHALRPCRFDTEVLAIDPEDADGFARAVAGCELVFACDDDHLHPERMVPAARHLAEACRRARVSRLVVVSSAEVYEPLPPEGTVDEQASRNDASDTRRSALIQREDILLAEATDHAVILQPGIAYGPYTPWTERTVERLRWSRMVVNAEGGGTCNAVYIDDVVEAALVAATSTTATGRYIITGPEPITWRKFFDAHAASLGVAPPTYVDDGSREAGDATADRSRPTSILLRRQDLLGAAKALRRRTRPLTKRVARRIGDQATVTIKKAVKRRLPRPQSLPDDRERALYRSQAVLSAARIRAELGWSPRYTFDHGMALTAAYLRWACP